MAVIGCGLLAGCATGGSVSTLGTKIDQVTKKTEDLNNSIEKLGDLLKTASEASEMAQKKADAALKAVQQTTKPPIP